MNDNDECFGLELSVKERSKAEILIVEDRANERTSLKMALRNLGYSNVTDSPSPSQGLKKMELRNFTHVIFQARKSDLSAQDFLDCALQKCPNAIYLASSFEPTVDNVFSLLIQGARGYLVCPFTLKSLDNALIQATKGDALPEELLMAKDRNEALVAITMSNLDRVATTLRQSKKFDSAKKQLQFDLEKLRIASQMAKVFCEGGEEGFFNSLEKFSEKRASGPATKLGRLRQRLSNSRH